MILEPIKHSVPETRYKKQIEINYGKYFLDFIANTPDSATNWFLGIFSRAIEDSVPMSEE